MTEALLYLSYLGIVLLIGVICTVISKKIKIPNILLLILVGMTLGNTTWKGSPLIEFPQAFLTSMAILALAVIVFDSSSRFKLREFDSLSTAAVRLTIIFLILNVILLTPITYYLYRLESVLLALLFSIVMAATAPGAIMSVLGPAKTKIFHLLEIESIINTPLIVLIPFLLLDIMEGVTKVSLGAITTQIVPFAQQFITGIGTGVIIGLIMFKIMRKKYSITLSPLAIITAALLTYVLAETLNGNGVLAVTTAGLFFGNVYIKHKRKLQEFSATFSLFLEILVFVLIGLVIKIPISLGFFLYSFYLFAAYVLVRFLAVIASFAKSDYSFKEKLFLTLNMPKGIAVAVVVFTLSTVEITGMKLILDLILTFMVYSIILSSIVTKYSKYFTKVEAMMKEKEI